MSIAFHNKDLVIDGTTYLMPWQILDIAEHENKVFVLFDPDEYLLDPNYKKMRRQGAPAIRNFIALNRSGSQLWEAEFPENVDYYYKIVSDKPLIANSFSSYRCEIDINTGKIIKREFYK